MQHKHTRPTARGVLLVCDLTRETTFEVLYILELLYKDPFCFPLY